MAKVVIGFEVAMDRDEFIDAIRTLCESFEGGVESYEVFDYVRTEEVPNA
jgi:hypothetical protein